MMTPLPRRRTTGLLALTLFVLVLTGCGLQPTSRVVEPVGPTLAGNQAAPRVVAPAVIAAQAPTASFEIRVSHLTFVQQSIAVAAPGRYRVRLINGDDVAHEVGFDDGTHILTAPGESASAIVTIPAAGSAFFSVIPAQRAAGMVGQIAVGE